MPRFFVPPENIKDDKVNVVGTEAHHLSDVCRLKKGDEAIVFDGTGKEYTVAILDVRRGQVSARVLETRQFSSDVSMDFEITVAQGIPHPPKMDLIVRMCTELGVKTIVPTLSEKSESQVSEERLKRWQRIAKESSKQCGRRTILKVEPPTTLEEVMQKYFHPLSSQNCFIVMSPKEDAIPLKKILSKIDCPPHHLLLLIGPEGGLTEKEEELATRHGGVLAKMPVPVLRAETAAVSAVSMITYELSY